MAGSIDKRPVEVTGDEHSTDKLAPVAGSSSDAGWGFQLPRCFRLVSHHARFSVGKFPAVLSGRSFSLEGNTPRIRARSGSPDTLEDHHVDLRHAERCDDRAISLFVFCFRALVATIDRCAAGGPESPGVH